MDKLTLELESYYCMKHKIMYNGVSYCSNRKVTGTDDTYVYCV